MIGIIDYGMGNIFSLQAALNRLNVKNELVFAVDKLDDYKALMLPGVGAFKDAMINLEKLGLDKALVEWTTKGKPLLGICLGMQLFFEISREYGNTKGLGLIPGTIEKIPARVKIPHIGWNKLNIENNHPIFKDLNQGYVYFVHSYFAKMPRDLILAQAPYGVEIPAIVAKNNIVGMQFHPEKSGQTGLKLLENWIQSVNA
ncbi:imidazole glycerol phosphate synthase subunit hisH [Desulfonispora thiosulfatigenes DSM 11270]|uniref:Imidazole glycerol phosphate synthase subunit HisH n=1 Tax=Desulfonispora thiosulfatigenes DSM 11270 TaxID=656914 RepID=A0A1W1V490_DESTI|nr:imidazole glycerol phosphate synthase subunit HisH [Desulfonispora thiosulfatigenes]SMB88083.1 imidazole glycerol phosphate synthase subunit hisH [Desulfonispora thiosulfatigenes DSM 11270]